MKNILIICSKLAEKQTGGVQTRIINYVKNLPKFGLMPILLSLADYSKQSQINYFNASLTKIPKNNIFSSFKFLLNKRKIIKAIHILEGSLEINQLILLFLARFFNITAGISLYGGEIFDAQLKNNMINTLKLWSALLITKNIIINSKATKNFIPKYFYNKTHIVYPGVNLKLLENKNIKAKNNKINLLYVGRLIRRKGLDDIIKALKIITNKFNNISLTVVGKEKNMEIYQNLIEKSELSSYIEFKGETRDLSKLASYYNNCDIFLMTPKLVFNPSGGFESFGCVYLEAGLFKKPVIGTNHFGVKEAIINNQTGLLVSESNPEEISKAILKLINNPALRKRLGENNFNRTIKYFTDINSTRQLAKIYL